MCSFMIYIITACFSCQFYEVESLLSLIELFWVENRKEFKTDALIQVVTRFDCLKSCATFLTNHEI